jgi:hypothetical protein
VFGVPARISPWRIDRRNQHLTRNQFIWSIGVLGFGMGMLLLFATLSYGEGRHITLRSVSVWLLGALICGFGIGFSSAPHR